MGKLAIVTQSYRKDFDDCSLLCRSIDRFASEFDHFIFVNDEDYEMFNPLNYGGHMIYKKSTILPWYLVRCPIKVLGHHFHISPFTIPVREWIIQQICKLGVFDVIGDEYDAVFNIDSEAVLMRHINIESLYKNNKFMLFQDEYDEEPSKSDYIYSAKKLLNLNDSEIKEISKWNFMSIPACFERNNLLELLNKLGGDSIFGWKWRLCNTYRFSEYYTYGIYVKHFLNMRHHFRTEVHPFPQINRSSCRNKEEFVEKINRTMENPDAFGILLQKSKRKSNSGTYLDFDIVNDTINEWWDLNS